MLWNATPISLCDRTSHMKSNSSPLCRSPHPGKRDMNEIKIQVKKIFDFAKDNRRNIQGSEW